MALGVRLSEPLDRRLRQLSAKTHRPKSYYIKEALSDYLDLHESELLAIADYEEQVRKGTVVTYTLEEIKKRHGLD